MGRFSQIFHRPAFPVFFAWCLCQISSSQHTDFTENIYHVLKVDSNEKWGESERWHWLGISLGLWRSLAICHLNMQLLCKNPISFSACWILINRRCDVSTNFIPSIRFAYSRCENSQRQSGPTVLAERTRLRQYIGRIIVYILNRQGGSNLHHVAYSKSKLDAPIYWHCKS